MARTKKETRKEFQRRVIGINVMTGTGRAGIPPCAHLIYEVNWSDGTTTTEKGNTIRTLPGFEHLNGTKQEKEKALQNLRTDLYEIITALGVLIDPVAKACLALDEARRVK